MKNKGFTLVELLGIIVLLVVIFLLVFPSVTEILTESEETVYQKQINNILKATYDFSLKHQNYLPKQNEKSYVTLGELKYEGLVDFDIKDPTTSKVFQDNLVISIHNVGNNYKYTNDNSMLEGSYLYTVETEKINNLTNKHLLPKIILDGLTKNSNGNYIITLNLEEDLNNQFNGMVIATSSKDEDITNKVKKYILKNDKIVESIDSSKAGIYKIIYSVVDNVGYANITILNVIVADTIIPEIIFPENNTIGAYVTEFDLLENVKCSDNSGFCDIITSGKIDYGVIGKYVIEYIATDPSGNTTTKKRVITIE